MNVEIGRDVLRSATEAEQASEHNLSHERTQVLLRIFSQWKIVLLLFLVFALPGLYVIVHLPKRYTAETVLALDPRRHQTFETASPLNTGQLDPVVINSEVSLLQLPEFVERAVRKLELIKRPEYGRGAPPQGHVETLRAWLSRTLNGTDGTLAPEALEREKEALAMEIFFRHLHVANDPRTYNIRVRYTSLDPSHAAEVANTVAELHIAGQREDRVKSIQEASKWLHQEIGALQERVTRAEAAEHAYRQQYGLGDDKVASVAQQEVNALTLQVTTAGAERAQMQARHRQATAGVLTALEEAARVAVEREANVRQQLEQARARLDRVLASEAGLRALSRESTASRVLLEDLMRRARAADAQMEAPRPEARIVSRAAVPTVPSSLGLARLVPAVVVGSAVLAIGLVGLMVQFQPGFRTVEQAERQLGVDAIGEFPRIKGGCRKLRHQIVQQPTSEVAEAARSICTSLLHRSADCPVILVTSPAPGDGKTALTTALAQTLALSGRRCLLIDADFRRPSLHRLLNMPQQTGFYEVLTNAVPFEDAVTKVLPGPLMFVPAGEAVGDPLGALAEDRLASFLDDVRSRFDAIIFDSPPLLAVSDAVLMATHADHIVLALRWGTTTRAAAARAVKVLKRRGARRPLLVLTQVDRRRTNRYEEGRYGMDFSYDGRQWSSVANNPRQMVS